MVGLEFGSWWGAVAGVGLGALEIGYDKVVAPHVVEPVRQEFNFQFNTWLNGVYQSWGVTGY